jgi:hypothetical protein
MAIEDLFPSLSEGGFRTISSEDGRYNCVAWAAGRNDEWWDVPPGYHWPADVQRNSKLESLINLYESLGFVRGADESFEQGFDKVAVYGDRYLWTHAARQLPNGKWTSKIGSMEDIEHDTLMGLCGDEYGSVMEILRRKA